MKVGLVSSQLRRLQLTNHKRSRFSSPFSSIFPSVATLLRVLSSFPRTRCITNICIACIFPENYPSDFFRSAISLTLSLSPSRSTVSFSFSLCKIKRTFLALRNFALFVGCRFLAVYLVSLLAQICLKIVTSGIVSFLMK